MGDKRGNASSTGRRAKSKPYWVCTCGGWSWGRPQEQSRCYRCQAKPSSEVMLAWADCAPDSGTGAVVGNDAGPKAVTI
eukprot:5987985-Karenia_brevis.AAC.1